MKRIVTASISEELFNLLKELQVKTGKPISTIVENALIIVYTRKPCKYYNNENGKCELLGINVNAEICSKCLFREM